jgi:hypothetical protein
MSAGADFRSAAPDEQTRHLAYAEASVMVIECLMLTLIEQRVLTKEQLVTAIESVIATKRQMLAEDESPDIARVALGVLGTMANSLSAATD